MLHIFVTASLSGFKTVGLVSLELHTRACSVVVASIHHHGRHFLRSERRGPIEVSCTR